MLACESVHGIFHGVGGEDFAIGALDVGGLKVVFETYGERDLSDIVATLLLGNAQQMNSRTPVAVFSEADGHLFSSCRQDDWRSDSSADRKVQGGMEMRNGGLKALGRENSGHLEHTLVILLLLELRAGFSVDNESNVAVELQCGGSHRGCKRSFNGFGDGRCLRRAASEKQNSLCFENGANSHGDRALRNFFFSGKELAIVFDGFPAENF